MDTIFVRGYPVTIVCMSIFIMLLSYSLGALSFFLIAPWLAIMYGLVCVLSILAGMRFRCIYCYYYGKTCASGLGLLTGRFFKKGNANEFGDTKNLVVPGVLDIILLISPLIGLFYVLAVSYSWPYLLLLIMYLLVAVFLGFISKKRMTCRHCKQGQLGCPAYDGMRGKSKL
jgi:hypothetical protein